MDPVAAMDQTSASLRSMAPVLAAYRVELLKTGMFDSMESFEMTLKIKDRLTAPPLICARCAEILENLDEEGYE